MPIHDLDAVFYVERGPVLDLRDGHFHVCFDIGRTARFEVVLPPHAFLRSLRQANKLAMQFHEGADNIVSLRISDDEEEAREA